jgi:hypothetical protein
MNESQEQGNKTSKEKICKPFPSQIHTSNLRRTKLVDSDTLNHADVKIQSSTCLGGLEMVRQTPTLGKIQEID